MIQKDVGGTVLLPPGPSFLFHSVPPIGQSQPYVRGDKGVWIIKFIENFSGYRTSKKVGEYGFEGQKFELILCVDRKKIRSTNQRT